MENFLVEAIGLFAPRSTIERGPIYWHASLYGYSFFWVAVPLDPLCPMPQPQEQTINLAIRNDVADLVAVTNALDRLGEEVGFPTKALMQLQVALDEVLSNVIKYAWPDGGLHKLRVSINAHEIGIEVVITDDGQPFDPCSRPTPELPPAGQRPRPGGVGIHMVKQLVDCFEYRRIDELNRVTLTKRYVSSTAPEGNHDGQ